MDIGDQADRVKFMIRDRGSNFTTALDAVLADARIRTVLCNIQTPRMNAIAERWIGGWRREVLDRTLIWNPAHLRRILHTYEAHHNQHRPHRSLYGAAPLKPLTLETAAEYAIVLATADSEAPQAPPGLAQLSPREQELLTLVARGKHRCRDRRPAVH